MKRRIIKLGSSTQVISLPKKWTNHYGLSAGNELDVEEKGKQLTITTEKDTDLEKRTIDLTNLHPLINFGLLALYIGGLDELEITSQNPEHISKLPKKPINQFIGYEIIEQTKNRALVKDVTGIKELELNNILRRVFLLVISSSEELIKSIKAKEKDYSHIAAIDLNVNRFAFLSLRLLNKRGADDYKHTPVMYHLVSQLESIGDDYDDLTEYLTNKKIVPDGIALVFLEKVDHLLRDYYSIFFKFDLDKATKIDAKYRKMLKDFEFSISRAKPNQLRVLVFAEQIANKIGDMLRHQLVISL
ncbi:hypothetical protein COV18_04125 [Candidatus Woesearchaeota archaeon CG10_big_fil_rev_8_21_14_0_10_37_12]|nr:MAG: hypothetical protein COV18_04125 [Candidatus Woesearchaeota archaeon CG10_big_fil_rev_8_21_14_0_10_37_12]